MIHIHELPIGAKATIKGYSTENEFTERLREMGLVVGTVFTLVRQAPLGGPLELSFGQSRIALRPSDDVSIYVEELKHRVQSLVN